MKRTITLSLITIVCIINAYCANIIVTNNNDNGTGSLRDCITSAHDGDIITFANDFTIYLNTPLLLGDKTITIDGLVDDNKVKLDGNFLDSDGDYKDDDDNFTRIFTIEGQPGKDIKIKNLAIQNGSTRSEGIWPTSRGGGMYADMSNGGKLNVSNCLIEKNHLVRIDEEFDYHVQESLYGAGVFLLNGGTFNNCTIRNNTIYARNLVFENIIGAGIDASNAQFDNCLIAGNKIICDPINNEYFYNLVAAGIFADRGSIVKNCIIIGNEIKKTESGYTPSVYAYGAGMVSNNSYLYNLTISYNDISNLQTGKDDETYDISCGGILIGPLNDDGYFDFQNSILYNNYCSNNVNNDGFFHGDWSKYIAVSDKSDFDEGQLDETCLLLQVSPFSVDPSPGKDNEWGTDDDDYGILRLYPLSQCIDAGNPDQSAFEHLAKDIDGNTRIFNKRIDMGAVEFDPSLVTFAITGSVKTIDGDIQKGKVYAIKAGTKDTHAAECDIEEDGHFMFRELTPGNYYLLAEPENQNNWHSTYFGNEASIDKAIAIDVNDKISDIDIALLAHDTSTNSETIENKYLEVYPNPVSTTLYIKGDIEYSEIIIYNHSGDKVAHYSTQVNEISMNDFPSGFYIVSFLTPNGYINKNIMVR